VQPGPFPFAETWTRLRGGGRDRNGDPIGGVTELDVQGCVSWSGDANGSGGNEQTDRRETVFTGRTLMLPPDTDAAPSDRWRRGGVVYEQAGEPGDDLNPFTGTRVLTIALKRVTG
jgi:hypothetical protein